MAATLVPGPGNLVQMAMWWHSAVVHVVHRVVVFRVVHRVVAFRDKLHGGEKPGKLLQMAVL